jgi:hypothetical protein
MPRNTRLDPTLLQKIADDIHKPVKYVREQISKRASRLGIAAESAQILWAKELDLGIAIALRSLPPHMQDQVRGAITATPSNRQTNSKASKPIVLNKRAPDPLAISVDYLLTDQELKSRCSDLLKKRQHQDRVLREATTILENRIKELANIHYAINPEALVNTALNPDPNKAILIISTEASEQAGIHSICRGIVLAFRHKAHHELDDKVTREDALKFCAFVDVILGIIGKARIQPRI